MKKRWFQGAFCPYFCGSRKKTHGKPPATIFAFAHLWLDNVPSTSGECGSVRIVGRCLSTEPIWICFTNLSQFLVSRFHSKHYHALLQFLYHFQQPYICNHADMFFFAVPFHMPYPSMPFPMTCRLDIP